jgi:predicted ATPase/DNA-binding winged helix-turn-helix (wHTH) protein
MLFILLWPGFPQSQPAKTCKFLEYPLQSPFMDRVPEMPASVEFGRFRVVPHRRQLFVDGEPVRLGGRAFDVLMALVEASGAVVSKDALMHHVWPGRIVDENRLQGEISALRREFGADRELIRTVAGRGYQFTGEIRVGPADAGKRVSSVIAAAADPSWRSTNLPESVSELIGREAALSEVTDLVAKHRLVTLVGEGGIGKTRLGLEAGRQLLPEFADGVWVAELAPLANPDLVPVTVATALGLEVAGGTVSFDSIASALNGRRLMLVLDNCEHVIEAAASMAGALLRFGGTAHVLATSREPLLTEGECLYRVPSLAVPAEGVADLEEILRHGAVQLFMTRATSADPHFSPDARNVATLTTICRRLDGIPLAIELAAARGASLGVEELATRLDDRFHLLTGGRRTALPRHRTLRATLDWSYELLPQTERVVLRRLAVFAGGFTLAAASVVAADGEIAASDVVDHVANLVCKSLVAADIGSPSTRYRLLETNRAYALEKLAENGEQESIALSHAKYYRDLLTAPAQDKAAGSEGRIDYAPEIDNIRAALAWAFGPTGNQSIAVPLAAGSAAVWLDMFLLTECSDWTGKAVASLDDANRGTRHEMQLQAALGFSLMFTKGTTDETGAALVEAVALAERLDDPDYQLRALFGLCTFHQRLANFRGALDLAQKCAGVADNAGDPGAMLTSDWMLGVTLFFLGELDGARTHLQRVCDGSSSASRRADIARFGFDPRIYALGTLGVIRWLQGFSDQAVEASRSAIDEAQSLEHPVSLCQANWARARMALWAGDLPAAERFSASLLDRAEKHSLNSWYPFGLGVEGELSMARGDAAAGVRLLRACLDKVREARYQLFYTLYLGELAKGVAATGDVDEGLAVIGEALERAEHNEELWYLPELLRIKGELLLMCGKSIAGEAEDHFSRSLALARRQGMLSWELRAGMSVARLWHDQRRSNGAHDLLAPIYDRFTEGFETTDLQAARALLDELR